MFFFSENSCKLTMSLNFARVIFDLPQRSILGPVIFSLYVADFQDGVMYKSFQYADQRNCLVWSCEGTRSFGIN